MDMCYDGALVLPSSYAVMNEEEMTYMEELAYLNTLRENCLIHIGYTLQQQNVLK